MKRNRQRLYVLEHDNFDGPIKVGSKCKDEAIAKCVDSGPHEDESNNKPEDGVKNGTSDEKPLPVPELLVLAGASIVVMGNLALFEDFYSQLIPERSSPPTQRQRPSESPENSNNRYRNRLSPEAEKRLRDCLKENIKNLVGVPELSDLVESLTNEDEYSITETQRQVRLLYKQIQQLRKTITDCDPSLIQELLAADQADEQEQFENQIQNQFCCEPTVTVVGEIVNVRASPSLEGEVIGQVLYGTCLGVDTEIFTFFSAQERSAAMIGTGWYPIVLPDGRRGYIHSQYLSFN
ncbi:SH3 domain-containing protein [Leptolyngbya sp. 7M]|uniref:SH3 domain-containing protein n=1 Tax=Leptolyngbya sp. 7M TaxID=2812896 RepID=UPI001B8C1FA2|nr:SH3 domain-containing protein [Leptolyngbya sp. 7M]QYO66949.1 SH3 domain-containing protein [Leptolyngbya sp. 7M]